MAGCCSKDTWSHILMTIHSSHDKLLINVITTLDYLNNINSIEKFKKCYRIFVRLPDLSTLLKVRIVNLNVVHLDWLLKTVRNTNVLNVMVLIIITALNVRELRRYQGVILWLCCWTIFLWKKLIRKSRRKKMNIRVLKLSRRWRRTMMIGRWLVHSAE